MEHPATPVSARASRHFCGWVSRSRAGGPCQHLRRPAETVPEVILRGQAAAHGLSFPSGHAMVVFAVAALAAPYLKGSRKALPWALAAALCLSRVYLRAHFPLDILAGAGVGMLIGGVLN